MIQRDGLNANRGLRHQKMYALISQIPSDCFRFCSNFLPSFQDLQIEFKLNDAAFALIGNGQ